MTRRTIADRYEKAAANLLRQHGAQATWTEARYWRAAIAYVPERHLYSPRPRDCRTFYLFCHELAHIALDHRYLGPHMGMQDEMEADVWAVRRLKRLRGWVPQSVRSMLIRRGLRLAESALQHGCAMPDCLNALAKALR